MNSTILKKLTIAVVAIGCLSVAACGHFDRSVANFTGHSETCVDGVKYLQFPSGATVKYNKDGSVQTCN